jgi:plasmid stabilization system protein ParE
MQLEFAPEARVEIIQAAAWYNEVAPGLGQRFVLEVDRTIERILQHPLAWTEIEAGVRRALMKKFPYSIYYTVQDTRIRIHAVTHQRRRPGSWRRLR